MLCNLLNIQVFSTKKKEEWKQHRETSKLIYTIPRDGDEFSIRDIVNHSSGNKTDFMYSALLTKKYKEMIPEYIMEALKWLAK